MKPLGLLTYRALLRKLDLCCLTAGPLISSVNCHRLCRCGFYRHIPFLKSSPFMTISINSVWDNLRSLWGLWGDHLGVVVWCFSTFSKHIQTQARKHTHIHACILRAVSLTLFPHDQRCPPAQRWRWFRLSQMSTKRTQSVEWVHRWWESYLRSICIYSSIT